MTHRNQRVAPPGFDSPLLVRPDNLVERPWGGDRLHSFKGLEKSADVGATTTFGESFELAACPEDPEAAAHPSRVTLGDGRERILAELLQEHGRDLLGPSNYRKYGASFPVLPKFLDIRDLLSVQAHPPGHPELYQVIEAELGASLRLGFSEDLDPEHLGSLLSKGISTQHELLGKLRDGGDLEELQAILGPALASSDMDLDLLTAKLSPWLEPASSGAEIEDVIASLYSTQRSILESMNSISVAPGDLIYNAQPTLLPPSAAIHALGNPEGLGVLLLEVRRPGPTLRAWDHARFPIRETDLLRTLEIVPGKATHPADFRIEKRPLPGEPSVHRSVANPFFVVDHLYPVDLELRVETARIGVHSLHTVRGSVEISTRNGELLASLGRGRSAFVPACAAPYAIRSLDNESELVRVSLPDPD